MKKFLAIALIAASFAACNEAKKEETTTTTSDTTTVVTPAVVDTMQVIADTTVKTVITADTTKKN